MKKIFLLAIAVVSLAAANAQNQRSSASKTPAEPLVNGIPYSQYKAQQEALKNKQQAQSVTAPSFTTAKPATAVVDAQTAAAPATPKVTIEKPTGVQPAPDAKSALVPEAPKEPVKAEKGKG
jgi:hypothetical protein